MKISKIRKGLTIAIVCVITTISLWACGNQKNEVKSTIENFEKACNKADIDEMLEYLDPAISEKVKLATGFASMFTTMDSEQLLDALAGLLIEDNALNTSEFFSSIKITVEDVAVSEDSATAIVKVAYRIAEEDYQKDATINCVYTSEKWYISDVDFD